jgi:hypothetical protein
MKQYSFREADGGAVGHEIIFLSNLEVLFKVFTLIRI